MNAPSQTPIDTSTRHSQTQNIRTTYKVRADGSSYYLATAGLGRRAKVENNFSGSNQSRHTWALRALASRLGWSGDWVSTQDGENSLIWVRVGPGVPANVAG